MACVEGFSTCFDGYKSDMAEVNYLRLRQELKESIRKKKSDSDLTNSQVKNEKATDNYGSFFGPSQPSIARKVIQGATGIRDSQLSNVDQTKSTSKLQIEKKQKNVSKTNAKRIKDRYIQTDEKVHKPSLITQSLLKQQIVPKKEVQKPRISNESSPRLQFSEKQQRKRVRQDHADKYYENILSSIRETFRLNPNKYEGVDYDHERKKTSMFEYIINQQMRSERLARNEAAIERKRKKTEEQEEMQERTAKKPKIANH